MGRLQKAHVLQIPFENLDIHADVPIELDIQRIYQKVILNKRGGFCYELNGLFYELLLHLGYEVRRVSARVYSVEKGYSPEFDHMALIVTIENQEYLSDVGFGEFSFGPIALQCPSQQIDPRGLFHVDEHPDEYICISKDNEHAEKTPEYKFKPMARAFGDFHGMCQYQQDDPHSHFRAKPLISMATAKGRITLAGQELKIRRGQQVVVRKIENHSAFSKAAWKYFRLKVPPLIEERSATAMKA
ncbi:MAG: arylamine N-acetyltransferase [Saprospiraceae bacterium]|nr:arylamine N-acetyltransferase [Saprospiraceae bacterium]